MRDVNGLYLRIGEWGEVSSNFAKGEKEAGVSVYDLVEGKPVVSPDATDSHFAEMDLAERTASQAKKYLVKGDYVGVGHDGEPLLANLVKVAEVEICSECGGLEVKSVADLHIRHVGHALYPVFRYPVPSVEHGLVALQAVASMDMKQDVKANSEMAPFASEVMAAYSKHRATHYNKYEKVLGIGQRLERKVGESWQEWKHRHQHGSVEIAELMTLSAPGHEGEHGLDSLLMS